MQKSIPRIVIGSTQSGSGKTTIVTGILAVLRKQGYNPQAYKIGPDYIDPGYHELASGHRGHNLDTWLVPETKLNELFTQTASKADIAVIEGVMGLYDGGRKGISSTAEVAKKLKAPVILVIDAKSMGESAAAIALGFKSYDENVNIAGVILNRLGSLTHKKMIAEALQKLGIPLVGAIFRNDAMKLPERHLGLLPVTENDAASVVAIIGDFVEQGIDFAKLLSIAQGAELMQVEVKKAVDIAKTVKIAVASDEAFSFYYPASMHVLETFGAEIIPFSPLQDTVVPEADGIILGGGFPEMFIETLQANIEMKVSLRLAAAKGMPIYAECGGYMYLMEKIVGFDGKSYDMTGILPGTVQMNRKLQMVGYIEAKLNCDTILGQAGTLLHGHEFHFSSEVESNEETKTNAAFTFTKTRNNATYPAGTATKNILGSYLHLHFSGCPSAAEHFIAACKSFHRQQEVE
jgi:cobyrinic acid a,c-diamide synthase